MIKSLLNFLFFNLAIFAISVSASARSSINNSNPYFFPDKYASLVVDAKTGDILHQQNADAKRYPASLTKMMTLYLAFQALNDRRLSMNEMVNVSRHAAAQPRMKLGLRAGEKISVNDLINSVIVLSANDSAVVLAERISGTESGFAKTMTNMAKYLGMKNTNFANASGLPNANQYTNAKDMAKLLVSLRRDFPQYYNLLSKKSFVYKRQEFGGHNRLLRDYAGAKAGKTGFINASGFNLALNAERNGNSLVGVVMGGKSATARDNHMRKILDENFAMLNKNNGGTFFAKNNPTNVNRGAFQKPAIVYSNVKKPLTVDRFAKNNNVTNVKTINSYAMNDEKYSNRNSAPASLSNGYQPKFFFYTSPVK
ncbi:MAG: D-alanyl-D-alanine carboxypeptidase family protein [Rickettsiales bacterium]|nr:D-alanyl-D-alanine carboxypeptidase family protein [Rickettsiales bacterium]